MQHKLLDDPVEDASVEVLRSSQGAEILYSLGTLARKELDKDVSHRGVNGRRFVQLGGCVGGGVGVCDGSQTLLLGRFLVEDVAVAPRSRRLTGQTVTHAETFVLKKDKFGFFFIFPLKTDV